jgi:hypothetical protein
LLTLPEEANIGAKVNAAMREIEKHNPQLAGVLPAQHRGVRLACELEGPVDDVGTPVDRVLEVVDRALPPVQPGRARFFSPRDLPLAEPRSLFCLG